VGWEEWIKGETHCGKDIRAGKVSLLDWSILNKINEEYVRVCSCDPLCAFVYTVWDKAGCTVSNKRHKLHSVVFQPILQQLRPTKESTCAYTALTNFCTCT